MELAEEQTFFDLAYKHRERRRSELGAAAGAAANAGAAQRLRAWAKGRADKAKSAPEAVAFGRIDESSESLYIGHEVITDEDREVLVVNWQAPAAQPYYEASHDQPHGLVRKREFTCDGNRITDFADVLFAQLAADVATLTAADQPAFAGQDGPDRLLLAELAAARDGIMHDIVATIQAAQYELIRSAIEQLLIIEGGPGTGKTAVALHRVSYLLYHHRDTMSADDILVVGPNPAFIRYIQMVLPDLGNGDVTQSAIGDLAPRVARGRDEAADVARLKGDARMARLLAGALEARIGTPEAAERMMFDGGRFVTLSGVEVQSALTVGRGAAGPYAQRRALVRARLLAMARDRGAPTDIERLEPVDNLLERLWPQFSPPAFLRDLLGSRRRLTAAARGEFTPEEIALLHRRGADRLSNEKWSTADLPLLDEIEELLIGVSRRYFHIVVDEAQDLSPMQLRSIGRRSATGSMTIVGDLAQSTGPWARDRWIDLLHHLPANLPPNVATLRYGYRVPRQVYDFASQLLPLAAPGMAPLTVVRDGPADPLIHQVDTGSRAARVAAVATEHAAAGRYVGIVCLPAHRDEIRQALGTEVSDLIHVVDPYAVKGLEFDAVIVVEPADIVASDERGHRLLFIALTRTTRYLDVVCVGEPMPLSPPVTPSGPVTAQIPRQRRPVTPDAAVDPAQIEALAAQVVALISGGVPASSWDAVLQQAADVLDRQQAQNSAKPSGGRHQRRD